ncbi:MAG TPA: hypothetical protein PKH77_26460 [Anaerolineae bacterium]|nr:hypothetical protein [Anaerolineae bacterium]
MSDLSYVRYALSADGFIHNWLIAGPQAILVADLEKFTGEDFRLDIARAYTMPESGITGQPVEPGPLTDGKFQLGDYEGQWRYVRCVEDHLVDLSTFHHLTHYLRAWAYAEVESSAETDATLTLTTNGPADVWLNDAHIHRQEHFARRHPLSVPFAAHLGVGRNRLLVRIENVAARDCIYVMALRITDYELRNTPYAVLIPTTITPLERRNTLETVFEAAYIPQDVFTRDEEIAVRWPDKDDPEALLSASADITARLQTPAGKIYAEVQRVGTPGSHAPLGYTYQSPTGAYDLLLMPRAAEYYEGNMRISRKLCAWGMGNHRYHTVSHGDYEARRREALTEAARLESNVFSEIAKMAIGWWSRLEMKTLLATIEGINVRRDCSDFYLVGLLGMLYRFGDNPQFPADLRQPLEDCILNFKYWHDEPGADAMWYWSENHQILFHACEILAGQLYPDRVFTNNGQTGQWHREHGEQLALAWLCERGMRGFSEWDSNCYFEEDLLALSHLADLAETDAVWELASVLIDKILFTIAVNSYKGVFGSTHGRTYAPHILGGYMESTAGITNLLWGQGIFNQAILGTVSMACMENYELPVMLQVIAADLPEELWSREHHAPAEAGDGVDKVTYKTPDGMLCSAQDYHPGAPGVQQHVWQATLGPGATVFVNHPPCASLDNAHRPNFWAGNVTLPRVAQWKDVLIAIHSLPEDDWLGFTHAYFPTHSFDEYVIRDGWAFARKDKGYLALTASQGFQLIRTGHSAYRELRSLGLHNIWLCHMGRAVIDGDFTAFQEKILKLSVTFDDLSVRLITLGGETLTFGWEGDFRRNNEVVPLHGFKHYDNPYCVADFPASQMDIEYGGVTMRLKFAEE